MEERRDCLFSIRLGPLQLRALGCLQIPGNRNIHLSPSLRTAAPIFCQMRGHGARVELTSRGGGATRMNQLSLMMYSARGWATVINDCTTRGEERTASPRLHLGSSTPALMKRAWAEQTGKTERNVEGVLERQIAPALVSPESSRALPSPEPLPAATDAAERRSVYRLFTRRLLGSTPAAPRGGRGEGGTESVASAPGPRDDGV
ncbi:hypothetical protein SKAU_G00158140 [Synaphobranchus kaupii]|uniref:Uncharacterized protein n=1 Tax=Synaphobranchus kaupii TaxID=118154 RepID=A0A9Q1FID1_SYNKA|nr:hypothetical protein SKAU_G00158140 [Synaphobranchus kaupii]